MTVKVIDNFLLPNEFEELQRHFFDPLFPWFIGDAIQGDGAVQEKYNWQLFHMLYHTPNIISEHMPVIQSVYNKLNPAIFIKAKLNCNFVTDKIIEHGYHNDVDGLVDKTTTAVYYINTNNGYTAFADGTKVESIENRMVLFPASMSHTGSSCTDQKRRIVLNLNYIGKENA